MTRSMKARTTEAHMAGHRKNKVSRAPHDFENYSNEQIDKMIRRLLNAAEWSLGKFEELKERVESPLAALECVRRCTSVAQDLQAIRREIGGSSPSGMANYTVLIGFEEDARAAADDDTDIDSKRNHDGG
jgi:hypothetical protein